MTTTRISYSLFLRSGNNAPFLGISTEVYKDYKMMYSETHILEGMDDYNLQQMWIKWRDFLQQGEPTKVTSGYAYGKYIQAVKEWRA